MELVFRSLTFCYELSLTSGRHRPKLLPSEHSPLFARRSSAHQRIAFTFGILPEVRCHEIASLAAQHSCLSISTRSSCIPPRRHRRSLIPAARGVLLQLDSARKFSSRNAGRNSESVRSGKYVAAGVVSERPSHLHSCRWTRLEQSPGLLCRRLSGYGLAVDATIGRNITRLTGVRAPASTLGASRQVLPSGRLQLRPRCGGYGDSGGRADSRLQLDHSTHRKSRTNCRRKQSGLHFSAHTESSISQGRGFQLVDFPVVVNRVASGHFVPTVCVAHSGWQPGGGDRI